MGARLRGVAIRHILCRAIASYRDGNATDEAMAVKRGKIGMLSHEHNEMLCRVGRGTPMGEWMRQYWVPALPSTEFPTPDCPPKQMMLLGENLVMFRDGIVRLTSVGKNEPPSEYTVTLQQPHLSIGPPPRLGRSGASSARRDGVEG